MRTMRARWGCMLLLLSGAATQAQDDYTILRRIDEDDSVVAAVRMRGVLYQLYDQTIIGAEFDDPYLRKQTAFPGFTIMQSAAYTDRTIERAMQIGLGIGSVPSFLREQGIPTDVVEISDAVVTLAADYFQYERCEKDESECPNGRTFVTDGLAFLEDPPETPPYDLFIIDVYTGWNPFAFFVREVMQGVRSKWLRPRGLFVMNFVGFLSGPHSAVPKSIYRTLQSVYTHVKCFREMEVPDEVYASNVIFYASDEPFEFPKIPTDREYANPVPNTYFDVVRNFPKWEIFTELKDDLEVEIHQALDAEEVEFRASAAHDGARVLTQAEHGQKDFKETHTLTQDHMRDRVIAQFPRSLWDTLEAEE